MENAMPAGGKVIHGHGSRGNESPTYWSWLGMKARCERPSQKGYPRYGGRGITVCSEWQDFSNFLADMGERPPGTTLDRLDIDGNYCKDNCRWATRLQQGENRSTNTLLTYGGKTQHLNAWARDLGVHPATLSGRLLSGLSAFEVLYGKDKDEVSAALSVAKTKHGRTPRGKGKVDPTYGSWQNMKTRVTNPKADGYVPGITMCDSWLKFENFLADMGERPPDTTLRRLDSSAGYEKGNCVWAPNSQFKVSRVTSFLVVGGVSKPRKVWAEEVGIPWDTIRGRLRAGWTTEEALGMAPRSK